MAFFDNLGMGTKTRHLLKCHAFEDARDRYFPAPASSETDLTRAIFWCLSRDPTHAGRVFLAALLGQPQAGQPGVRMNLEGVTLARHLGLDAGKYTGRGFPDLTMWVEEDLLVLIEHKLDSGLGPSQLERYVDLADDLQADLANQGRATRVRVALIAPRILPVAEALRGRRCYLAPPNAAHFRWQGLAETLAQERPAAGGQLASLRDLIAAIE